jgi:hypothetical protein
MPVAPEAKPGREGTRTVGRRCSWEAPELISPRLPDEVVAPQILSAVTVAEPILMA